MATRPRKFPRLDPVGQLAGKELFLPRRYSRPTTGILPASYSRPTRILPWSCI